MRIVFMGTPDFAVPSLEALAQRYEVVLAVTRPDAVRSRGKRLEPSPVKAAAQVLGISVFEARRLTPEALGAVREARPDLVVVAAFGAILPDELLQMAPLGCINVHASLLPRWRGAAPIQRAILAGDERAGVSIMRIAHDLDAGPYCRQASTEVGDKGDEELTGELARLGAQELVAAVGQIQAGTAVWTEQDASLVTLAPKVSKQEMRLDPADTARANALRVQASSDAAPARLVVAGRGMRVMEARPAEPGEAAEPGVVRLGRDGALLGCTDGALRLLSVKPDGKRQMTAQAWAAGQHAARLEWARA